MGGREGHRDSSASAVGAVSPPHSSAIVSLHSDPPGAGANSPPAARPARPRSPAPSRVTRRMRSTAGESRGSRVAGGGVGSPCALSMRRVTWASSSSTDLRWQVVRAVENTPVEGRAERNAGPRAGVRRERTAPPTPRAHKRLGRGGRRAADIVAPSNSVVPLNVEEGEPGSKANK